MAKGKDALDQTMALLKKKFGDTSAIRLGKGRQAEAQITEALPTGIEVIDHHLLGIGGLPIGRMSEVVGEENCGKTTFSYSAVAACQRAGGTAFVLDAEHSFDEGRAVAMGVNLDDLVVLQPDFAEMGLEQTKLVLSQHNPKSGPLLIAWDTIASMVCKADLGRAAGERGTAELPRLMSTELPKIIPLLKERRAHLLALNQVRAAIGVMFGPQTVTPGGRGVKFYASWRMQFFGGKAIKHAKTDAHTGKVVTLVVIKTRLTEPFRKARVRLDYATGWNNEWSTLEHAKSAKVLAARGAGGKGVKGPKAHAGALLKLGWAAGQPAPLAGAAGAPGAEAKEEEE